MAPDHLMTVTRVAELAHSTLEEAGKENRLEERLIAGGDMVHGSSQETCDKKRTRDVLSDYDMKPPKSKRRTLSNFCYETDADESDGEIDFNQPIFKMDLNDFHEAFGLPTYKSRIDEPPVTIFDPSDETLLRLSRPTSTETETSAQESEDKMITNIFWNNLGDSFNKNYDATLDVPFPLAQSLHRDTGIWNWRIFSEHDDNTFVAQLSSQSPPIRNPNCLQNEEKILARRMAAFWQASAECDLIVRDEIIGTMENMVKGLRSLWNVDLESRKKVAKNPDFLYEVEERKREAVRKLEESDLTV